MISHHAMVLRNGSQFRLEYIKSTMYLQELKLKFIGLIINQIICVKFVNKFIITQVWQQCFLGNHTHTHTHIYICANAKT
jgi:hypothetical protein